MLELKIRGISDPPFIDRESETPEWTDFRWSVTDPGLGFLTSDDAKLK